MIKGIEIKMSYTRWGSVINHNISFEKEIGMFKNGMTHAQVREAKLQTPGAYKSKWYIYWSANPMDEDKREDQLLAMWHADEPTQPLFTYDEVKHMYESNDWSKLGSKVDQLELARECVGIWLQQVEEEFKTTD